MKKIFAFFSCLVVLSFCLLIPVSASSPTPMPTGVVLDLPALNLYPDYLIFDDTDLGNSNVINIGDQSLFEVYRTVYDDRTYDIPFYGIVYGLDADFNIVNITSFDVDYFHNGSFDHRETFSNFFTIEYTPDFTCSISLVRSSASVKFITVLPCPYFTDDLVMSDYYDSYYHSIYNYFFALTAYQSGFESGAVSDYYDGFRDGQQYGDRALYNDGYDDGYEVGHVEGYSLGYDEGRENGIGYAQNDLIAYRDAILTTVSAPFVAIANTLDFEVLGINLSGLFAFLITAMVIAFIIKKFA